jgi:hypothetical protein
MAAMRAMAAERSLAHRRRFVGRELGAITLHTPEPMARLGRTAALTENFLPVELEGQFRANQLVRLCVNRLSAEGALEATIADAPATFIPGSSRNGVAMAVKDHDLPKVYSSRSGPIGTAFSQPIAENRPSPGLA